MRGQVLPMIYGVNAKYNSREDTLFFFAQPSANDLMVNGLSALTAAGAHKLLLFSTYPLVV